MKSIYTALMVFFLYIGSSHAQSPVLAADSVTIAQGGTGEVTYTVTDFWNICNFNGTITWDPAVITYDSITFKASPLVMYPITFNFSQVSAGILSFVWYDPITVGSTIANGAPFIKIKFSGIGNAGSTSVMSFSNNPQPLYWYNFSAWTGTITTVDGLVTIGGVAAPVASFTYAGVGLDYTFTNTSGGGGNTYSWTFGDGNGSTLTNPSYSYAIAGSYQVCLTATNGAGGDSACHMVYAVAPPVAAFTVSGTGLHHVFTNTSTGNATTFQWTFGDGNTSPAPNPTHTYLSYGTYQVCLNVSSPNGNDSTCHMVYATLNVGIEEAGPTGLCKVFYDREHHSVQLVFREISPNTMTADLYDLQGQKMASQTAAGCKTVQIDASALKAGIYLVKIVMSGKTQSLKIVVD